MIDIAPFFPWIVEDFEVAQDFFVRFLPTAQPVIGAEIGAALSDPNLGLAVWAAVHGLAMLVLENVIDLGQRRSGLHVLPSRSEILLRSLFSTKRD